MRNFLEAFFRRRTAIILIALVATGIIALGTFCRTPQYMSETRFMIPIGRELGAITANPQSSTMLMMNYADQIVTQMEVLKNRRLIEDALLRMPTDLLLAESPVSPVVRIAESVRRRIFGGNGAASPEAAPGEIPDRTVREWLLRHGLMHELTDEEALVEYCARRLGVERQNDSGVILLRFIHPSPVFARAFLVRYLEAYESLRASSGTAESDMSFYAGQEPPLREALRQASDRLAEFRREWGLLDIQAQREQNTTELARLEQIINESKTQIAQATAFTEALQTEEGKREPETVFSQVMRDDPAIVHNLRSIAALLARESRLKAEVGANHPELILIQRETAELRDGLHRAATAALRTQLMNAQLKLHEATNQREETESRMVTFEAKTVEMRTLESDVEVASAALLAYGRNREQARVTSQMDDMKINSVMIIEPPTRPFAPESPKPFRDIALGFVFSLFLGLYYAYFMETFGDNVNAVEAVAGKFPGAALVSLPELKKGANGELPVPESIMAMLGRKFFYHDKHLSLPGSILVVSGTMRAGATAVAKMLARYVAHTYSLRVLLVDAHLAHVAEENTPDDVLATVTFDPFEGMLPEEKFPESSPDDATLSDWLLDRSRRPAPCAPGEIRTLWPGRGGTEPRAAMLRLSPGDLAELGDFDVIVFDALPLIADSVAFHLAALAEATIPVVRMERTRKGVLQSLRDNLAMSGASVMGVVCNRRKFYIPQWIYKRLS